jgi:hypothetical protein
MKEPIFIFGKRGQKFDDKEAWNRRLQTGEREVFDKWVWGQLQVEVEFVNEHDHPVEGMARVDAIERASPFF